MNSSARTTAAWLFLSPAMTAIGIFFVLPVLAAFVLSFTDFDIYALGNLDYVRFVGFENYIRIFDMPLFWSALQNTFYFVLVGGPLSVAVSLGAALMLNSKLAKWKSFYRAAFFLPVISSLIAVSIVWRYLYHPAHGLLNYALSFADIAPVDWLGDPDIAMPAIIIMAVWKNFGYNMLIFIAGLQNISDELYEAAHIDGAGWWMQFKSTMSIVLLMYEQGFRWWNMGFAAAIAFILFLIIMIFTFIQLLLQRSIRK